MTTKSRKTTTDHGDDSDGTLSADERAALKDRTRELRRRKGKSAASPADDAQATLDAIAGLGDADRAVAERIHALITAAAPELAPKTWYGMPAYARDGKVVCFFQPASKFKSRYATLGFNDSAKLDDGAVWPVAYAVITLSEADEAAITELVKRAVS